MGKGSAPSAPDPNAVANAQMRLNQQTANQQAALNRVDQYGPMGSQTWQVTGTMPDGTPKYTQTTTLNPQMQAILNGQMTQDLGLMGVQNSLLNQINANSNPMGNGFMPSSGYHNPTGIGTLSAGGYNGGPTMRAQAFMSQPANTDGGLSGYGGAKGRSPSPPSYGGDYLPTPPSANSQPLPSISQGYAAGPANTISTANVTPVQGGMYQGALDQWGKSLSTGAGSAAQAPTLQAGSQGYNAQQTGPAAQAQAQYAGIAQAQGGQIQNQLSQQDLQHAFDQQQQSAYNGSMAYLSPQFRDQTANMRDQLAQQGITQQSNPAAYQQAMDTLARQQTFGQQQALNNSYQQGLAGANQLFNQNLQAGEFANAAQQQGFNQSATNAGFQNQANLQNAQLGTSAALQNALQQNSNQQLNAQLGSQAAQFGANSANTAALQNAAMGNQVGMYNAGQTNQQGQFNSQQNNAAMQQRMQAYLANAGLNNQANAQGMQNMFALNNAPINQLNALRGMTQVQMPQFGSYAQASGQVAPNYSQLAQNQYQAQLGAYNNQMQGLFNFGAAALPFFL